MKKGITPERVVTLLVSAAFLGFCIYYGVMGDAIRCVQALALALIAHTPRLLANKTGYSMGQLTPILFCTFITMAVIVGTFLNVYFILPQWDKMLHLSSGIMIGAVAYSAVEEAVFRVFKTDNRVQAQAFIAFVAFCVGCAAAVVWEMYEFTLDRFLDMDCQRYKEGPNSGLMDTMWDIILGSMGGAAASIVMWFATRRRVKRIEASNNG